MIPKPNQLTIFDMRQITLLTLFVLLTAGLGFSQDKYPVATPTDSPDVVISPFDENRRLDVAGLEAGSLAEDPIAKKIFRIPYSNPTQRYYEDYIGKEAPVEQETTSPISSGSGNEIIPPPPVTGGGSAPAPEPLPQPSGSSSPSWVPNSTQLPEDLLSFIYAFNQNSSVNKAEAVVPFYANPVESYFGKSRFSHSAIRADRDSYIKRWPNREYVLDGTPVLLAQNGNVYEVLTRVRYNVSSSSKSLNGAVSHNYRIRRGNRRYEILSISEARASAAPASVRKKDLETRSQVAPSSMGSRDLKSGTVYSRFESDQINLFLDAFAASGEVNQAGAQLDFLHPGVSNFYGLKNPNQNALLKNRRDFINQWPTRRYWLTEKPIITPLSSGSWEVIAKTGWEVKNGSKKMNGVANNHMRLTHTPAGLKVTSVVSK